MSLHSLTFSFSLFLFLSQSVPCSFSFSLSLSPLPHLLSPSLLHHIYHYFGLILSIHLSEYLIPFFQLHYISPNVGGSGTVTPLSSTSVFAYIGTPPQLRRPSKLTWRQGPCHLFDEILPNVIISNIWLLGPNYVGSFQAPLYSECK